jgi:hypothetical protein
MSTAPGFSNCSRTTSRGRRKPESLGTRSSSRTSRASAGQCSATSGSPTATRPPQAFSGGSSGCTAPPTVSNCFIAMPRRLGSQSRRAPSRSAIAGVAWLHGTWQQLQSVVFTAVPLAEIRRAEFAETTEELSRDDQGQPQREERLVALPGAHFVGSASDVFLRGRRLPEQARLLDSVGYGSSLRAVYGRRIGYQSRPADAPATAGSRWVTSGSRIARKQLLTTRS